MYEGYGGDFLISEGMRGLLMDVQTSPVTREGEQERQPLPHNQTLCQNSNIIRPLQQHSMLYISIQSYDHTESPFLLLRCGKVEWWQLDNKQETPCLSLSSHKCPQLTLCPSSSPSCTLCPACPC